MNITIADLLNKVKTYNSDEIDIIKKAYNFYIKNKRDKVDNLI